MLFLLFLSQMAMAQNVTASFDSSLIGENPAAAATREFSLISPFVSATKTEQDIKTELNGESTQWNRTIEVQRYELIYAPVGKKFASEIYVSANQGQRSQETQGGGSNGDDKLDLLNAQINLAAKVSNSLTLGLILFNPRVEFKTKGSDVFGSDTYRYDAEWKMDVFGMGLGATSVLFKGLTVGAFYTTIKEEEDGVSKTQMNSDPEDAANLSGVSNHQKMGIGVSYKRGNSKSSGVRVELSYIKMKWDDDHMGNNDDVDNKSLQDSQTRFTIEGASLGFKAGAAVAVVFGQYLNHRYFIDSILEDMSFSPKMQVNYSGFFGFKSSGGGSFGGFVTYFNGNKEVSFQGNDSPAKVKSLSVGANFSYLF